MAQSKFDDDEISGINITPLVDVVLVLLVIFMITAPTLYQNELRLQLPKAVSGQDPNNSTQPFQVAIDSQGEIKFKNKVVSLQDLEASALKEKPQAAVILADKKVTHGQVIELIDHLKASGVQKFSFGVDKN